MKKFISGGVASLLVAGGLVLASAGSASAHTPGVTAECDSLLITASYYDDGGENSVEIIVDGASLGVAPFGSSAEYVVPLTGTGHEYTVKFTAWNDPDGANGWTTAVSGSTAPCEVPVPEKPEPVVYHGEWGVGEVDCDTRVVTEGRYVWTHDWTYDETTNSWVENVTGTETVETREVPATEEQCPLPDPEPIVVTPVAPTAEAGIETCVDGESIDASGSITLPEIEGLRWEGDGGVEYSGTLTDVAPGEYGFTAVALEGYVLEGDSMQFVTVPASADVVCEVEPQPEPEPTTPAPAVPAAPATPAPPAAALAATGSEDVSPLALGAALLLLTAGGAAFAVSRRRTAQE